MLTSAAPVGSGHSGTSSGHSGTSSNDMDPLQALLKPLQYDYGQVFKDLRSKHYTARSSMWGHYRKYEVLKDTASAEADEERTKGQEAYMEGEDARKEVFKEAERLCKVITDQHKGENNRSERAKIGPKMSEIGWQVDFYKEVEKNPFDPFH